MALDWNLIFFSGALLLATYIGRIVWRTYKVRKHCRMLIDSGVVRKTKDSLIKLTSSLPLLIA